MKVVSVNNVGKSYILGRANVQSLSDIARNIRSRKNISEHEFWALRDVSFDVNEGEVLGIIGKNGAGKSTLLKVLSQITQPTNGEVKLQGRVASLLEVGTGFHPELSGKENVFLNGAILGMSKKEIRAKYDQIVEFSGVEKFLDTPVKHYSSGMYVRLAFAVAAHLEPEILIIDEVLAVGDMEFQQKCLGKMKEVAGGGRTVLFVSHNMSAIRDLCSRCILLESGQVAFEGSPEAAVERYLFGDGGVQLVVEADTNKGVKVSQKIESNGDAAGLTMDDEFNVVVSYENLEDDQLLDCHCTIIDEAGNIVYVMFTNNRQNEGNGNTYTSKFTVPGGFMNEGRYHVECRILKEYRPYLECDSQLTFELAGTQTGRGGWHRKLKGIVRPTFIEWETQRS